MAPFARYVAALRTCSLRIASPRSSTSLAPPPRGECIGECSGECSGVDSRLLGLLPLALPLLSRRRSSVGAPSSSTSSSLLCRKWESTSVT